MAGKVLISNFLVSWELLFSIRGLKGVYPNVG